MPKLLNGEKKEKLRSSLGSVKFSKIWFRLLKNNLMCTVNLYFLHAFILQISRPWHLCKNNRLQILLVVAFVQQAKMPKSTVPK